MSDGGPAFPRPFSKDEHARFPDDAQEGMSLRDYFAASALQGMAASAYWSENFVSTSPTATNEVAKVAYIMADAMLKARKK